MRQADVIVTPLVLTRVLQALGDPVRLGIVRQLARDGTSSCAALDGGRPKSSMSHHFRVLREAGLVHTWAQGTTHMNALCREAVDAAFPGLLASVLDVRDEGQSRQACGRKKRTFHARAPSPAPNNTSSCSSPHPTS